MAESCNLEMRSVAVTADAFAKFDAVVISTAHQEFKNAALYAQARSG